jgi:hypothetical protein
VDFAVTYTLLAALGLTVSVSWPVLVVFAIGAAVGLAAGNLFTKQVNGMIDAAGFNNDAANSVGGDKTLDAIGNALSSGITAVGQAELESSQAYLESTQALTNAIANGVSDLASSVGNATSNALNAVENFGSNALNAAENEASSIANSVENGVSDTVNWLSNAVSNGWNSLASYSAQQSINATTDS